MTPFYSSAFRRLWFSSVLSMMGTSSERTLTAWLALQSGGGAVAIGLIFAARMLPSLLFGLAAGTIADRIDRSRQLIAVAGTTFLVMAGFGWLIMVGNPSVWLVIVWSFLAGCVQVFDTPARQALILDTVAPDTAMRALALSALGGRFASVLGALGAGWCIARVGLGYSYIATAAVYGISALLVATVRVAQEQRAAKAPTPFRQALRDAAWLIVDAPVVRTLIIAGLACEVFAFSHLSALPLFAQNVLATNAEGLGTLNAAISVGGALAVVVLLALPERVRRQPLLGATYIVYGLAIVAFALTRDLATATVTLVVTGFCAAAFDVLQQTLIQVAVPAEQRGRAVGVWVLMTGSAPLGHLEMGVLIAAIGVPIALAINGVLTIVSATLFVVRAPDYRWLRLRTLKARG